MTPNILKSLMKPEAYPVPTRTVEMLQTHVSWIFLTETHAFKLKKPVNFGFLDFSTVDRRRFYCDEELRLNRRLCPDIYEAVVELRETLTGAAFHGNGQIIDHAVMMKRLPADRMLDRLVEAGETSVADMQRVAGTVSSFHAGAGQSAYISEFGSIEKILYNWRENFDQLIAFETTTLPPSNRETISSWAVSFTENNADLFRLRQEQGFIRECDGDLHLENICLTEDKVYIFDCIEFNERFRYCDTASDLAFLLMDLDYNGRSDLAAALLLSYQDASGDQRLPELIDYYKIYRAVVRGKVESFRHNDIGIPPDIRALAQKRAVRYFRLARGYIERLRLGLTLFITCGTMGCGKSTLAAQLAFELGIKVCSSDITRKKSAGMPPDAAAPAAYGQGLYSEAVSRKTYQALARAAECELAAGRSVIVDASFKNAAVRDEFARLASRHQAEFVILKISCDRDEQARRLIERSKSSVSVSDGRLDLLELQAAEFTPPSKTDGILVAVDSKGTSGQLADRIYKELHR